MLLLTRLWAFKSNSHKIGEYLKMVSIIDPGLKIYWKIKCCIFHFNWFLLIVTKYTNISIYPGYCVQSPLFLWYLIQAGVVEYMLIWTDLYFLFWNIMTYIKMFCRNIYLYLVYVGKEGLDKKLVSQWSCLVGELGI